jgi:hypothetical protein
MKNMRSELGEESSVNHPLPFVAGVHGEEGEERIASVLSVTSSD